MFTSCLPFVVIRSKNLRTREERRANLRGIPLVVYWHAPCTEEDMTRPELEARSAAFAAAVFRLCNTVRMQPGGRSPADQLADSASSAASNYRATSRSRSRKEFAAKIGVVAQEADEAVGWLEFMIETKLGNPTSVNELLAEAKELRNIFAASCRTSNRGKRGRPGDRPRDG